MKSLKQPHHLAERPSHHEQRGIALVTVLIILLLSSILVLGAFRVGFLGEILVGAESDHNRARAAAEALLRDAEIDIRGRRPPYGALQANNFRGTPCRPTPDIETSLEVAANYRILSSKPQIGGCRARQLPNTPYIPESADAYTAVRNIVQANRGGDFATFPCSQGICTPSTLTTMANFATTATDAMKAQGATYGQYTRQSITDPSLVGADATNPLLMPANGTTPNRGWYWIEIFKMPVNRDAEHVTSPGAPADPRDKYTPETGQELVYRITARAEGLKAGTQVVMTTLFIPFPSYQIN
jgi:type IV pilus assembly protein PilX